MFPRQLRYTNTEQRDRASIIIVIIAIITIINSIFRASQRKKEKKVPSAAWPRRLTPSAAAGLATTLPQ
ncbi:hypothetical protein LX32DRAFT_645067 [Colletotrichum zoysiae]|uniref:Uncharacterized protein n=1 Tax=Colletotrichum zoysiae TaxID=1216348 RepID=A0AAD9LYH1_9PEZI|nr:hypothetical protein LX32DRAFT_645067 [Colletotrichum zoysiae]